MQLLEWWYTQAESKLGGSGALPPPPPPPAPRPHPDGVPLPDDPAVCPICRQVRFGSDERKGKCLTVFDYGNRRWAGPSAGLHGSMLSALNVSSKCVSSLFPPICMSLHQRRSPLLRCWLGARAMPSGLIYQCNTSRAERERAELQLPEYDLMSHRKGFAERVFHQSTLSSCDRISCQSAPDSASCSVRSCGRIRPWLRCPATCSATRASSVTSVSTDAAQSRSCRRRWTTCGDCIRTRELPTAGQLLQTAWRVTPLVQHGMHVNEKGS